MSLCALTLRNHRLAQAAALAASSPGRLGTVEYGFVWCIMVPELDRFGARLHSEVRTRRVLATPTTQFTPGRRRRSLFFKQEMELTLVGLQNSGKTTLVNVVAVPAPPLCLCSHFSPPKGCRRSDGDHAKHASRVSISRCCFVSLTAELRTHVWRPRRPAASRRI